MRQRQWGEGRALTAGQRVIWILLVLKELEQWNARKRAIFRKSC